MAGTLSDQLDGLVDALGSERKAAAFVGVSHSQFGAWRAGSIPSRRSLTRIADGVALLDRLRAHGLASDEIRSEIHSLWSELGERPAVLVAAGETKSVLDAVLAHFAGRASVKRVEASTDLVAALRALAAAAEASADALAEATS